MTRVQPEPAPGLDQLEALETNSELVAYVIRDALLREAGVPPETAARIVPGVTVTTVDTTGEEVSGLDIAAGIAVPIVFVGLFMIEHLHHQRLPAPVGDRGEGEPRRGDRARAPSPRCR